MTAPEYQYPPIKKPPVHDGFAVASLVLGIMWIGGLGSLLAVIFGYVSDGEAKRAGRRPSAMATAGLLLGWAGLAIVVLLLAVHAGV